VKLTLGILQADDVLSNLVEDHGEYPFMFERLLRAANSDPQLHLEFITYQVNKGVYPADIDEVDAYIMTGSKSSVYEQTPWVLALADFVRTLHQHQKRFIGICFGHQMVAHALRGNAGPASAGWSLGVKQTSPCQAAEPNILAGKPFKLIYSHQDQVSVAAPGSEVLASTDTCPIAATSLGKHILTFQGHPEFFPDYSRALYQFRQPAYPAETYESAMVSLEQSADQDWVARLMINFCLGPQ
jgi:GMP synthase-like glutamine amidotransferase